MKNIESILRELEPIFEISLKKIPYEIQKSFIKNLITFVVSTIEQMYKTIEYFDDKNNSEIKRIHAIKNDKEYLDRCPRRSIWTAIPENMWTAA